MRSWSLAVSATALLLASVALATTLDRQTTPPDTASQRPRTASPADATQTRRIASLEQGLGQALADLEEQRRQTETLRDLVDDLLGATGRAASAKATGSSGRAAGGSDNPASLAALDPFGTGQVTSTLAVPKQTEQEVRAVLARVDAERQRQRAQQQAERQRRRSEQVIQGVRERLSLSEEQAKQLTDALVARDAGRRKAWSDGGSDAAARRAAAEAVDQQYEQTLQQLLAPAQYQELQAIRKETSSGGRRGRRGQRGQGG